MSRKDVFISGTGRDLRSYRGVAKQALLDIGAHPVEQTNFPTDHRELDVMLGGLIDSCDAVIHLVGRCYGEEPAIDRGKPRRSFTQWEYHHAIERDKSTYVFIARPHTEFDAHEPEDGERRQLQDGHREQVRKAGRVYYEFSTAAELRELIHRSNELRQIVTPRLARIPFRPLHERFSGRTEVLAELEHDLTEDRSVLAQPTVVRAGGGYGKTTLAVEIGWRLYDAGRFRFVFFLNASTPESLDGDLAALATEPTLALPERTAPAQSTRRDAILGWLSNPEQAARTLLILDSVDAPEAREAVRELLPRVPHCATLITSRHTEWSKLRVRELQLFTGAEAVEYLRSRLDPAVVANAHDALARIAEAVDHLPVALEIVASLIHETRQSPEEWLAAWRIAPTSTLDHHDADTVDYPVSLARVYDQSLSRLSAEAVAHLCVFALMAPRPAVLPLGPLRAQPEWQYLRPHLAELAKSSLISWPQGVDTISMHRVLQTILLDRLGEEDRNEALEILMGVLNVSQPEPEYDDATWRIWAQLEPHLKAFAERLQEFDVDLDAGPLVGAYATWLTYAARYEAAERFYRQAAGIAERRFGPSSVAVATQLTGLMSALLGRNKVAEAEAVARRALDIFAAAPQPDGNSCYCLNILGEIVRATRPHEAIDLFQRAISCSQALLGPSHPHTMVCAHNLASVLLATGQIDKAEPILADLLPVFEKAFGTNHPNVAAPLNELGECARLTGRYTDAARLYQRSIEILEASYGTDHPLLASALSNLGLALGSLGLAAEAETHFTRALSIDGNRLGWVDPKVANRLGNLAWLFKRTGRSAEAEAHARQAVKILLIYKARERYDHANWASVWKRYTDLLTERGLDAPAIDAAYQELMSELAE